MKKNNTELAILFEDNHLIVINKQCGDLVQGDKTGDKTLADKVKSYIKEKYNKPGDVYLGIPHRLDRPTSGIVMFAKTSKALTRLNEMFKNREMGKIYWAIVEKKIEFPAKDKLVHYLKKNSNNNKTTVFSNPTEEAKKAILNYTVLSHLDNYSLLEVDLETGRNHQIRAQLSFIGIPIKGDLKYKAKRSNPNGGINLHARSLTFIHPIKKETISFEAPTPKDVLWDAASTLLKKEDS